METAGLYVTYDVDLGGFNQKVKQAESNFKKSADAIRKAGASMTALGRDLTLGLTAPLVLAGGKALLMASDMQESLNKVDVAFKSSSKEVRDFAKISLSQFGITQAAALDTAALFGDMATGMGLTTTEAASMATKLTGLSGDLASFKNIQQDVAKTALAGIFTGETESLKQLGIVMTQTNLEAFALASGINKTMKEMTEAEKINLRYAFILDKTKNSQGDFARTSDGFANQMRILNGTFQDLVTEMATGFLPMATKLLNMVSGLMNSFRGLTAEQKAYAVELGILAALAGPTALVMGKIASSAAGLIGIFRSISLTMATTTLQITAIVAAVGLLALLGKTLYDSWKYISLLFEKTFLELELYVHQMIGGWKASIQDFINMANKVSPVKIPDIFGVEEQTKHFEETKGLITKLAAFEKITFDGFGDEMAKNFKGNIDIVKGYVTGLYDDLKKQVSGFHETIKGAVSGGSGGGSSDAAAPTGGGGETALPAFGLPDFDLDMDTGIDSEFDAMIKKSDELALAIEQSQARIKVAMQEIGASIGQNMGQMITEGKSLKAALKGIFNTIIQSIISAAVTAIAAGEAIKFSWTGIGAIGAAAGAAAAAGAFFSSMPAFAAGGYHSGGMALVGERGPEIINTGAARVFNAGQTERMLSGSMEPTRQGQSSGGGTIEMGTPTVKIKGNDIVMAFEKAKLVQRKGIGFNTVYNS